MQDQPGTGRSVIAIGGDDREKFLQGLVTNDVALLADGLVYAALLSPQGKYLADFFLKRDGDRILVDVASDLASDLVRRLSMYRLRADVSVDMTEIQVARGTGDAPDGALLDPRHASMGWRLYGTAAGDDGSDWDAIRVAACIPESGIELVPNESYVLECGFERLNGVDFRKGCYVGQEITARMKHKTQLRKGLATVAVRGTAAPGTEIRSGDRIVGALYTQSGERGIAYLRFDRAVGDMMAGDAIVHWHGQDVA